MVSVIVLVVPTLLAMFVSYWSTNLFKSLTSRSSRITCLISPGVLAAIIAIALADDVGGSGTGLHALNLSGRYVVQSLLLGITTLLIFPTLLFALAAGKLSGYSRPAK